MRLLLILCLVGLVFIVCNAARGRSRRRPNNRAVKFGGCRPNFGNRRPNFGNRRPYNGNRRCNNGRRRPNKGTRRPNTGNNRPNIIYIMADDLGWNDVGFHNSLVKTPHLDSLASNGIELTNYYTQPLCSPSRSALVTGKYPSNNGLSQRVVREESRNCLPLEHKIMPEYMKELGYASNYVGKWHLGYCNTSCLPTNRGIDKYRGIIEGAASYFTWEEAGIVRRFIQDQPSIANRGTHQTLLEQADAKEFIEAHAASQRNLPRRSKKPLFMIISPSAPHSPLDVTDEMFNVHDFLPANIPTANNRRKYLGLVSALDGLIGSTIQALKDASMYENTVIVFTSDNGGASIEPPGLGFISVGNNYPLRNGKFSFYEGGTRAPTLYFDPRLKTGKTGEKRDFLMHITDWLPTFAGLAGRRSSIAGIDGIDQADNLGKTWNSQMKYTTRNTMLYGLTDHTVEFSDCSTADAAFRWQDWKLIYGNKISQIPENALIDEWKRPSETPNAPAVTGTDCMRMENGVMVARCLFNVKDDPSETINLYDDPQYLSIRNDILVRINQAKASSVQNTYSEILAVGPTNTRPLGDVLVPKPGFCTPMMDFPLIPNAAICSA